MLYVGIKQNRKRVVFRSAYTPTQASHGHLYVVVIGPFRTLAGAKLMAEKGEGNPHMQTVADAERIARLQAERRN